MRVKIDWDELYPYYSFGSKYGTEISLPWHIVLPYRIANKLFRMADKRLHRAVTKAGKIRE